MKFFVTNWMSKMQNEHELKPLFDFFAWQEDLPLEFKEVYFKNSWELYDA